MKKEFILLAIIISSCAIINPVGTYEKALARVTAERWSSGAPGGGRGATFRLNFYKLEQKLVADTLWVNTIPLQTEITVVGDTTYVSSFYFTEQVEEKTLANAAEYSGRLRVIVDEKVQYLDIPTFEVVRSEPRL